MCYAPLSAFYSSEVGASGKRGITFDRGASHSGAVLKLPCGQCVGCRLERSRQWAVRCMHEKLFHSDSCFLTLTYDEGSIPQWGSLVKQHPSAFCKRLHNRLLRSRGVGVRYYLCGEYGETTRRPHYHLLIFGYDFPDKKFFTRNSRGETIYTSEECRELWPQGHNAIGEVTFDSAAYVARYILAKRTGPLADYDCISPDGECYRMEPEFTNMSRRPGIGSRYYSEYGPAAYDFDHVVLNGKKFDRPGITIRCTRLLILMRCL